MGGTLFALSGSCVSQTRSSTGVNPAVAGVFRHPRLAGGGGGGGKRPHVIPRERMAAESRATRRSKALDETILKHP